MRRLAKIFGTLIMLATLSCTSDFNPDDLPSEYSYEVSLNCFCHPIGPHFYHIKDGITVNYSGPFDTMNKEGIKSLRIEQLHEEVRSYMSNKYHKIDIEYHPQYNFPVLFYVDVSANIADEEWGFTITKFAEL